MPRSRSRRATCRRRRSCSASRARRSMAGSRPRGAPVLNWLRPIPTRAAEGQPMTMYLEHFGLREAPFRITPHTEFFFADANSAATVEGLLYPVTAAEGLLKATGEVGSSKTMHCRVLL